MKDIHEIHLHIHMHDEIPGGGNQAKLDTIVSLLGELKLQGETIMIDMGNLEAEVAEAVTVQASAVVLLKGISQQLKDLAAEVAGNPAVQAKINAFAAQLDKSTGDLSAAVVENTPQEPPVPPVE